MDAAGLVGRLIIKGVGDVCLVFEQTSPTPLVYDPFGLLVGSGFGVVVTDGFHVSHHFLYQLHAAAFYQGVA